MDDLSNNSLSENESVEYVAAKKDISGTYLIGLPIVLTGIALSVIASFLKLFHIGSVAEMTAMEGDFRLGSWVTFGILFVVLVAVLCHDGGAKGYCFVGGFAVLGEALVHYLYVKERLSRINVLWINLGDAVKMDIGFYLMLTGGILLMIGGFFMPSITKKRGVAIMASVVCALVLAGVVVITLINSSGSKKDEETAKKDDAAFICDIVYAAEVVAIDPYCDADAGTVFSIKIQDGKVSVISNNSGVDSAWKSRIAELSHSYSMESAAFSSIDGNIMGMVRKDGSISWDGYDVASLVSYSDGLIRRLR